MPPKSDAPLIMPCGGCGLPVTRKLPHQVCEGWTCAGVWCTNCVPHSAYTVAAIVRRGVGHS